MSQFFESGGQSIGVSALASISPSDEYSELISFRIDWLGGGDPFNTPSYQSAYNSAWPSWKHHKEHYIREDWWMDQIPLEGWDDSLQEKLLDGWPLVASWLSVIAL